MADKPMYYGGGATNTLYYGGRKPMYYGGRGGGDPRAYGANYGSYGSYGSYGQYGQYGSYGGSHNGEDESIVGSITLTRMLRVISQRWLSVFAFLLVGLIVSFAVYRISPTLYQATSEFTMDLRRSTASRGHSSVLAEAMPDYGVNYAEVFNTRLSDWCGEKVMVKIVQQYRASRPASTVSDEDIMAVLGSSRLELVRNSRIITVTLRSQSPALCADLANAYAQSIEAFTDEENKARCDKAVSQIHATVERKRRDVDKIQKLLRDSRTTNRIDPLRTSLNMTGQALSKTTADILALETQETQLIEWEKMLAAVQKDPVSYGNLSTGVPRAQEIATEFRAYQDAMGNYQKLILTFTDNHPEVISAKKLEEMAKSRFLDAAERALQTGRSTLQVTRNQIANLRQKQAELRSEQENLARQIGNAESSLKSLESDAEIANSVLKGLIMNENQARIEAESTNEIVRVGRNASVPDKPVLPNPLLIFGVGIFLSLAVGVLFVLVIDNLEDTIVNLSDIEGRLSLKVLAVLPHVRRKKREEVAKFLMEDRYSHFSESIASLRNLLDSPRYEAISHCLLVISTQPGEGKTITSTSLSISYAQAGRRVLHVDFDLRRPRLAKIWNIELTQQNSFSHVLQNAGGTVPDFESLVAHTPVPGMDVIGSLPPEGVSPATIFGSAVIPEFFEWARANYDHIIVDSPPYGLVGDVVSLSVMVDSVIIMCCPDRTHFRPVQFCSRSLTEAGANILGAIVNDIEISSAAAFTPHSNRTRSYGKYGYGSYSGYSGYGSYGDYRPKETDAADLKKVTFDEGKPDASVKTSARPPDPDDGDVSLQGFEDEE